MALFARPSTPAEAQEIARLIAVPPDDSTAALRLRAIAIVQSQRRAKVPQIAQGLNIHRDTVLCWIKRFNHDGLAGLHMQGGAPAAVYMRPLEFEEQQYLVYLADNPLEPEERRLRAKALLLSAKRLRVPAIASTLGVPPAQVRSWIKLFNHEGIAWFAEVKVG